MSVARKVNIWELFTSTTEINMILRKNGSITYTCFPEDEYKHAKLAKSSDFYSKMLLDGKVAN